jgi:hypothetical protein
MNFLMHPIVSTAKKAVVAAVAVVGMGGLTAPVAYAGGYYDMDATIITSSTQSPGPGTWHHGTHAEAMTSPLGDNNVIHSVGTFFNASLMVGGQAGGNTVATATASAHVSIDFLSPIWHPSTVGALPQDYTINRLKCYGVLTWSGAAYPVGTPPQAQEKWVEATYSQPGTTIPGTDSGAPYYLGTVTGCTSPNDPDYTGAKSNFQLPHSDYAPWSGVTETASFAISRSHLANYAFGYGDAYSGYFTEVESFDSFAGIETSTMSVSHYDFENYPPDGKFTIAGTSGGDLSQSVSVKILKPGVAANADIGTIGMIQAWIGFP